MPLVILSLWIVSVCLAVVSGEAATLPELESLLTRYHFAATDVGYLVFDPTTGEILAAQQPDTPRIPASTTKTATMLAALQILGQDYRFETPLLVSGEVREGVLRGNLYLRGGGDPTLTTDDLREFVTALRGAGISRVAGSFLFDDTLLARTTQIDARQPLAVSYNPGVSALTLNYNRVLLRWQREPHTAAFVTSVLSPAAGGLVAVDAIETGSLPNGFDERVKFLHDARALDRWFLSPQLSARGEEMLPVKIAPGRIAALVFQSLCRQQGIELPPPQAGVVPSAARVLSVHHSEPLAHIATGVLRYSNNLAAELIGQMAARRLQGRTDSLRDSATRLAEWYHHLLPQTDWQGFISVNHSGLTSVSRHSPRQMAAILRSGWLRPSHEARIGNLLPPLSWSRPDRETEARVRAKSGTMSYADGLVGFLTTASNRQLGFVVLITDFAQRAALDAAFDPRISDPPPAARAWTERAKDLERVLIRTWILHY